MELRHIQAFIAVAEELHFTRAAERLHMAQPPLSQQIKQLEYELGVQLFERTTRKVHLTNAGTVYLDHAREILDQVEQARQAAVLASQGERGQIRVGLTGVTTGRLLSRLARTYRERYPNVRLDLHPSSFSGGQYNALLEGRIDVGFLRAPVVAGPLLSRLLFDDELVAVMPEGHPHADQDSVSLASLSGEEFVVNPGSRGSELRTLTFRACADAGFYPRVAQEAMDTHMILALVASGVGVALVPAMVSELRVEGIRFLPLDDVHPSMPVILAWRRTDKSPVLASFLELSQELFPTPARQPG